MRFGVAVNTTAPTRDLDFDEYLMTTRRSLLFAGGTLAASLLGCGGGGGGDVVPVANANPTGENQPRAPDPAGAPPAPTPAPTPRPEPAPAPVPAPAPAPEPSPPSVPITGGTYRQLGTVTLAEHLAAIRVALPEGLSAADRRMQPSATALAYCGATIWRGKYALPLLGGHGDSADDGGYAQDLLTGDWETMILPSTHGNSGATATSFGEYTTDRSNRPASQHTLQHLVTVGNDIIQANGSYIATAANGSRQAHRWNYSTGLWQRYGDTGGGISANDGAFAHYDAARNRIVRINLTGAYGKLDTIPANNPNATWTSVTIPSTGIVFSEIGCSMGYHAALDCYVLISPGDFTPRNTVYVMDAGNLTAGWVAVSVSGDVPPFKGNTGLEYCPPMRAMVTVGATVDNMLFYIKPTGGRTAPWVWSSEVFSGSTAAERWDTGGAYNGVYRRFVWSDLLRGFVVCKRAEAYTEVFVPSEVAAYYS